MNQSGHNIIKEQQHRVYLHNRWLQDRGYEDVIDFLQNIHNYWTVSGEKELIGIQKKNKNIVFCCTIYVFVFELFFWGGIWGSFTSVVIQMGQSEKFRGDKQIVMSGHM